MFAVESLGQIQTAAVFKLKFTHGLITRWTIAFTKLNSYLYIEIH